MLPRNTRTKTKIKAFFQLSMLLVIIGITLVGVSQLKVVREFLSRASGEPANIVIDVTQVIKPVDKPWRNLAQGGEAHDWRMGELVPQVKALKPEYIRIDHVYDFYDIVGGTSGNLTFNFSKLDAILDDIAATGAKPYIALSYMPTVISTGDIISTPKDYNDWSIVVQKTIEHVSGTRGTADVYYEVWNEPDLFGGWKYYGEKNYLTLYGASARGAANAKGVKPFKIGGPAITALYKNWFDALLKYASANNLRLDFFSWHRYNLDIDQYRNDMADLRSWIRNYPQYENKIEFHLTEWGHDSNVHPGYDSNYGAAHTVAGAIEMVGVVERALAFEIQDGKSPEDKEYWGRWGLFTAKEYGAKAKPRYFALRLLNEIEGDQLALLGKGSWVKALATQKDRYTYQIMLANFDIQARHSETVPITLKNLIPGSYTVKKRFSNGQATQETLQVTGTELQTSIFMPVNSVALVEIVQPF